MNNKSFNIKNFGIKLSDMDYYFPPIRISEKQAKKLLLQLKNHYE